jgi:hypothetical protein
MSTRNADTLPRQARRERLQRKPIERGLESHKPPASAQALDDEARRANELRLRQFTAWG